MKELESEVRDDGVLCCSWAETGQLVSCQLLPLDVSSHLISSLSALTLPSKHYFYTYILWIFSN